ncbi:hypothetical protein DFH06DRAFT_453735 [Mycena polygramma]|nr:hypothetical protein DFH06DRAFT_453735 [Mycena polygramma]
MHDALQLRNVSKLPASLRATALAAAKGSIDALSEIFATVMNPDLRTLPWAVGLLPVIYIHLDPTNIPTPDALDVVITAGHLPPYIGAARLASKSVGYLMDLPTFPVDVSPDLWLRIWPWLDFMLTYWDCLSPHFEGTSAIQECIISSFLIPKLSCHPKTREMMGTQYGVLFLVSSAWTALFLDDIPEISDHSAVLLPILTVEIDDPAKFEEILDGAGSFERLAAAIIKQISLALAITQQPYMVIMFGAVISFLDVQDPKSNTAWMRVLLSQGIVTHIVSALRALDSAMATDVGSNDWGRCRAASEFCFKILANYLAFIPGYTWVAEAIKAGFLDSFISFATREGGHLRVVVDYLIHQILLPSLVSPSVIKEMKTALVEIQISSASQQFTESHSWRKLVTLVKMRVTVLDRWEAKGRASYLACDNMSCGKIKQKHNLKRCAGCRSANYCSNDCQSIDWRDGHRDVCDDLRADLREDIPARDRAFMRALVHFDYERLLFNISLGEVMFMRDLPGEESIVFFNYVSREGFDCKVDTKALLSADVAREVPLARQAKSGGRMRMHVMVVPEGPRVYPLRSASAEFRKGLVAIAASRPFEHGSVQEKRYDQERILALMAQRKKAGIAEIH